MFVLAVLVMWVWFTRYIQKNHSFNLLRAILMDVGIEKAAGALLAI
jgi:hypothetical protein